MTLTESVKDHGSVRNVYIWVFSHTFVTTAWYEKSYTVEVNLHSWSLNIIPTILRLGFPTNTLLTHTQYVIGLHLVLQVLYYLLSRMNSFPPKVGLCQLDI